MLSVDLPSIFVVYRSINPSSLRPICNQLTILKNYKSLLSFLLQRGNITSYSAKELNAETTKGQFSA